MWLGLLGLICVCLLLFGLDLVCWFGYLEFLFVWILGGFVASFVFSLIGFGNACVVRAVLLFAIRFGLGCCFGGFAWWVACCLELFTCSLLWCYCLYVAR